MKKSFFILFLSLFSALFLMSSCHDPELNGLMDEYCKCISESRYDDSRVEECIEMIDAIREKYKGNPVKTKKVLDKVDECY